MEKYPSVIGGSPSDLNVPLIVKNKYISADYGIIVFEKPRGFIFEPGNWMDIRFLSANLAIGKTYSITSSPTEPDIMIAFKKGMSNFKNELEKTQIGDTMFITQYGSNGFLLNKKYQSLFIAGGIGITPFRSMIKEVIDTKSTVSINLIYLNHTEIFPFKEDLNNWLQQYPYLQIHYIVTEKEGHITKERIKTLVPTITDFMNYVAGPPGMVTNTKSMLLALGVSKEDIKTDSFDGY